MKTYNWLYPALSWQNRFSVSRLENIKSACLLNYQFSSGAYEILFLISGELEVNFGLRQERLSSRDVLFILPGTPYRFSDEQDAEVLQMSINRKDNHYRRETFFEQLSKQYQAEKVSVSCHKFLEFYERIHDLQRILCGHDLAQSDKSARAVVLKILNLLWACKAAAMNVETEERRKQIELTAHFLKFILAESNQGKNLETIAQELGVFTPALNKALFSATGRTGEELLQAIQAW